MRIARPITGGALLALFLSAGIAAEAQQNPLARQQPKGLGVSPTFEGWFPNPDGTFTLSFGYLNRNTEEIVEIPVGPGNFVEPGEVDQGQPTYFTPRRHYGVFAVKVPADFGPDDRVTWTLEVHGERYSIPGGLLGSYQTDNLHASGTNKRPPVVVLEDEGVESRGPAGAWVGPLRARAGEPLPLDVTSWDEDGKAVTLRWFKYRGPGEVTFANPELPIEEGNEQAATTAVFSVEGEYVLYVRADHSETPVSAAGLEQCCWTNGYVRVNVTR
ncbi:MAG: hypothetical protein WEG36_14310 [Gemmatimonadota bacterium]